MVNLDSATAPIALFVFNRPDHTKRTLDSLSLNDQAAESDLVIFSDGPHSDADRSGVEAVRSVVRSASGFNSVSIVERPHNLGLQQNILAGVSSVLEQSDSVIVVEDDILTSRAFLPSMNDALRRYENERSVWHINGWFYPVEIEASEDVFFFRAMLCWGWATWSSRWSKYQQDAEQTIRTWSTTMKRDFDLDDSGHHWQQILDNDSGLISSWDIFWYATIFEQNGLCLTPKRSLTQNIGHDGSGTYTPRTRIYDTNVSAETWRTFPDEVAENKSAVEAVAKFYKTHRPSRFRRALRAAKRGIQRFRRPTR